MWALWASILSGPLMVVRCTLVGGNTLTLYRAEVTTGNSFSVDRMTELFAWPYGFSGYDIHPDGDRLLVVRDGGVAGFGDVFIVTNWFTELCERMGGC